MKSGNRRLGRELAVKILFSLSHDEAELNDVFDLFWQNFRFADDVLGEALDSDEPAIPAAARHFAEELVRGVADQLEEVDGALSDSASNWSLDRMALVDLAILRLAAYELMYRSEIPARVTINEAIEIGKRFGAKETPSFVNGILDRIARQHRKNEA